MKITGSYKLNGPRQDIWPLIHDPISLVSLIPGCEQLEQISPGEYRGQVQIRLPAVAGAYTTHVKLIEDEAPRYCYFEGMVEGPAGSICGTASIKLEPLETQTILVYEGQALISGPLVRLDSRFAEGIVQSLIKQGLARLDVQIRMEQQTPLIQEDII
jgi:carbon monoxide dehydrogenase subunit G